MYFFGYTREVPFFPLTAFYLVLLPSITRFYSQNNIKKAREIITKMFELILIIIAPIAVIIAASAENILTLFYKPSYGAASIALAFQIFGEFFVGIMVVLCMIISSTGKKRQISIISILLLVVHTMQGVMLTKIFGINGAALALFRTFL